jgi:hypothetical protein
MTKQLLGQPKNNKKAIRKGQKYPLNHAYNFLFYFKGNHITSLLKRQIQKSPHVQF